MWWCTIDPIWAPMCLVELGSPGIRRVIVSSDPSLNTPTGYQEPWFIWRCRSSGSLRVVGSLHVVLAKAGGNACCSPSQSSAPLCPPLLWAYRALAVAWTPPRPCAGAIEYFVLAQLGSGYWLGQCSVQTRLAMDRLSRDHRRTARPRLTRLSTRPAWRSPSRRNR